MPHGALKQRGAHFLDDPFVVSYNTKIVKYKNRYC